MMNTLEAYNHGNGTLTVFITEQAHINWLRQRGVTAPLGLGEVLLTGEDRHRVYPTLTEAMSPAVRNYLETMECDYQAFVALAGTLV